MDLYLKQIREGKGLKQPEMAAAVSELMDKEINARTYASWERQEVTMNLEQARCCALVLGVTVNDLVGMLVSGLSSDEADLLGSYRACDDGNRDALRQVAKSLSKLPPGPEYTLVKVD